MANNSTHGGFAPLIERLTRLRDDAIALEQAHEDQLSHVAESHRDSARNLLHYLAIRRHDLRDLQPQLSALGLSSLGRTEAHALAGVNAVLSVIRRLAGDAGADHQGSVPVDFESGPAALDRHAGQLFGPASADRPVWVIVTMPAEAALHYPLIRDLVSAGMDVMRINCAHETQDQWRAMIDHLRRAELECGRNCRVWMDLAGPKLRTGAIAGDLSVIKYQPRRDSHGEVIAPVRVWLTPSEAPEQPDEPADCVIPVEGEFLARVHAGDVIQFMDTRERARQLMIAVDKGRSRWATADRTAYLSAGTSMELLQWDGSVLKGRVGMVSGVSAGIAVSIGDMVVLTTEEKLGGPPRYGAGNQVIEPAHMPCTLPAVFSRVKPGERVYFDDGKIHGRVRSSNDQQVEVEITHTRQPIAKLRADRGINLPDSELDLPALTDKDRMDLDFAVQHADMVSLSFIRRPQDVLALEAELDRRCATHIGVLLKIETQKAFESLPRMLLAGMRRPPLGVVVARGDLGVEVGFDRLAEVQEEILWVCESAHLPVIWATEVLDTLAKTGVPSRAEVTDAAMSIRAEAVMLNKGIHIVEALRFLSSVLRRMQDHHTKKRALLRRLSIATFT